MAEKRDSPYIWVTWIPQIMVGSRVCLWGPWFKTHYKGLPAPATDYRLAVRTTEHAERVGKLADGIRAAGYSVSVENENVFRVRRGGLTIGGKPDVVCWDTKGQYIVYDVKTGAKKDADVVQVMLYMTLLPYSKRFVGKTLAGRIIPSEGGYINICLSGCLLKCLLSPHSTLLFVDVTGSTIVDRLNRLRIFLIRKLFPPIHPLSTDTFCQNHLSY